MPKIEIYEDGKPMPTERVELLGMETVIVKRDERILLHADRPLTKVERDDAVHACDRFASGNTKFLIIPHKFKIIILKEE